MTSGSATNTDRFVNPYTFVGLPTTVRRAGPHGHHVVREQHGEDLWYGTVDVTWTLETPLLLPAEAEKEGWIATAPDGRHEVTIPGSSIKGAVRSLHETLFNGCLRVVDQAFVPGYRDAARQDGDPAPAEVWQLAVIASLNKKGLPETVRLCEQQTVWVEATALKRAYPGGRLPATSDVFDLDGDEEESALRVHGAEMHRVGAVRGVDVLKPANGGLPDTARAGRQVLLVSDTAARKQTRAERTKRGRAFWAVGTLTDESATVTADAWENFSRAVAGSRDREAVRREAELPAFNKLRDVQWWPNIDGPPSDFQRAKRPIARRKEVTGYLYVGDVVWVQSAPADDITNDRSVTKIKFSQLWRHVGEHAVKDRIPAAALPCSRPYEDDGHASSRSGVARADEDPVGLCLSCLIFGSADTSGASAEEGRQDSYAGHIRVGTARTDQPVTLDTVSLAPMGSPHPGAGMFYLAPTTPSEDRRPGDLPSQWGSGEDGGRRLRGRKYYWHSNPDAQSAFWSRRNGGDQVLPRHRARSHQERGPDGKLSKFVREALLVPAGTCLSQRIQVNGLTRFALSTLLAAIQPERVLGQLPGAEGRRFALRLGGGKPLGLGSASATLTVRMTTAADRYCTAEPVVAVADRFGVTLRELLAAKSLSRYVAQLARVLDVAGLGEWANQVSYPPGADWSAVNSKEFDESFTFFRQNSGEKLKNRPSRPYRPLPVIPTDLREDFDPTLPVSGGGQAGARQIGGRRPNGGRR